ncbi:MAG: zf-HC2 domain-containing protein [Actinobacteria bacterium]|nr:zf-HC2 domain-containing protein [Actinomycetota bacterium]
MARTRTVLLHPAEIPCRQVVELVTDYLEGALPPTERQGVAAHLEHCPHCSRYLDQMTVTVALLRRLRPPSPEPQVRSQQAALYRRACGTRRDR